MAGSRIYGEKRPCASCGNEFVPYTTASNVAKAKYCSKHCRDKGQQGGPEEQKKRALYLSEPRECVVCGKEFLPSKSSVNQATCSLSCNIAKQHKADKDRRAKDREERAEEKVCLVCGNTFKTPWPNKMLCSKECQGKRHNERSRKYEATLRPGVKTQRNYNKRCDGNYKLALKRDNHSCQFCGEKKMLEVHHVDGEGENGQNNHDLDNLMTLCRKCHKALHYVHLIRVDGKWYVKCKMFKEIGLSGSVPILGNEND